MNESCGVFHASSIGCWVWAVESQMEMEVGEFLFQSMEIVEVEHLVECTCAIEIMHLAIGSVQCFGHVHDLCTQRSHTCTTANPYHFLLAVEMWMEIAERTTHNNLVAWFKREDVRRSNTWIHIHKSTAIWFEWRSCNTYGQHEDITFCRIVRHRIGTDCWLCIGTF